MASLEKKTQSICTAKDMREATQTIMKPYANWEEYLAPAPQSIAILGELVYISSKTDFSLNKETPDGGYNYKHIKYPDSFRACLMQVCNSGWWAFNEAHTSMDKIRLHTLTVPKYVGNVVKILFQGNDEMMRDDLPGQLENIKRVAKECVECASGSEKRFKDVIELTQELVEVCICSKHGHDEEVKEIKIKLEDAKSKQQGMEKAKENYTKALKKVETELEDAKMRYEKSMNSLPGGWSVLGMELVQGITESITCLMNGITSLITRPVDLACKASMKVVDTYRHVADIDEADDFDKIEICSKSPRILRSVDAIGKFIQEGHIDWNELYDQQEKKVKTDLASDQLEAVKNELEKLPNCKQKDRAEDICKAGVNICKKLRKYAPAKQCSAEETEKILSEWESLNKKTLAFDSESKNITNSPAFTQASPMMNKVNNAGGSGKNSASQRATEIAYFRIEETRAELNKARQYHEKCVEKMENNEKELAEVLSNMRRYDIKEIDFNTTIQILIQGMDAMGRVQEQWQKMVRFFEMISNTVGAQSDSLLDFQETSLKAQKQSYDTRLLKKDMIYQQAFQASNIANLVHMISETYTCVSDKHLMGRIGMLSTLMTMDNTKLNFQKKMEDLRLGCEEAQKAILREVCKGKEDFDKSTAARLERIETELLPMLPAAEPEKIKAIREAVHEGFKGDTPEEFGVVKEPGQEGFTEDDMSALI